MLLLVQGPLDNNYLIFNIGMIAVSLVALVFPIYLLCKKSISYGPTLVESQLTVCLSLLLIK